MFELRIDSRVKLPAYTELMIKLRDTGGNNAVRVIARVPTYGRTEGVMADLGPQFQEVVVPISEFERLSLWVDIHSYSSANQKESVCIQDIELRGKEID